VRFDLERFEAGEIAAWWHLNLDLTLEPASNGYDWLQWRIIEMPGWIAADEETRSRIVNGTKKLLEDAEPQIEEWIGTNSSNHSDLSAYRSLVLLREVAGGIYDQLDDIVWRKWAPVVVAVPKETGTEAGKFHDDIAADAVAKAPAEFTRTVIRLIRIERRRARAQPEPNQITPFFILRTLDKCWGNSSLQDVIYAELRNRNNSPAQYEALLEPLLRAGYEPAREFAKRRLTARNLREARFRPDALAAATQLLIHYAAMSWPIVWQRISADSMFGHDLCLKIAHEYRHDLTFYSTLRED
jgi:hypothetical protein